MPGLGLEQLVDIMAHLESRALRVDPQQCSRLRHQRSSCTLCADCCPAQAITWRETLQVDPDQCTGCGICAAVCPTGALEARSPTNLQLLAQVQAGLREGTAIGFNSFCTNCRLCQDICYKQAVLLAPGVDLSQVLGDAVGTFLMREVEAAPGLASPEKKHMRLMESTYPKNE